MQTLFNTILPAQPLGIKVVEWTGTCATLTAPLAKNLNDKGTAFAGSIDSMLDLAGWSAIMLTLRDAGVAADVMITKSETDYTAPVRNDMTSTAEIPAGEKEHLLEELKSQGKCRIILLCRLLTDDTVCASMTAQYTLISKADPARKHAE